MITPKIITAPAIEPITLDEAKKELHITSSDDDERIAGRISAARWYCEHRTDRAFIEQTLEWCLDYWPGYYDGIELPRARPLQSVVSVSYKDSGNAVYALAADTDYYVDTDNEPGRIFPAYGLSWPSFTPCPANAVRIRYVAGASPSPLVFPPNLVQAMLMLVAHWNENHEAVIVGQNVTIESKPLVMAVDSLLGVHTPPEAYVL